jgi:hypothetical protein
MIAAQQKAYNTAHIKHKAAYDKIRYQKLKAAASNMID